MTQLYGNSQCLHLQFTMILISKRFHILLIFNLGSKTIPFMSLKSNNQPPAYKISMSDNLQTVNFIAIPRHPECTRHYVYCGIISSF